MVSIGRDLPQVSKVFVRRATLVARALDALVQDANGDINLHVLMRSGGVRADRVIGIPWPPSQLVSGIVARTTKPMIAIVDQPWATPMPTPPSGLTTIAEVEETPPADAVGAKEKAIEKVARAVKDSPKESQGFHLATMAKEIAFCAMNHAIGATSALGRKKWRRKAKAKAWAH